MEPRWKAVRFRERLDEEGAAFGEGSSVPHGPPKPVSLGEGPSCLHSCHSESHCNVHEHELLVSGGGGAAGVLGSWRGALCLSQAVYLLSNVAHHSAFVSVGFE